ncbi:MAG: hypothetical protein HC831_25160 [Chloroflexia bacterium]|nr:hypothetical protein [Chloroflexia bacterium]
MNKYYLIFALVLFLAWSCGSDDNANTNQANNEVIVENENNQTENSEVGQEVKQEPQINEKFKAFLGKFAKTSLPYSENPDGAKEYPKISMEEQVEYLAKAESLSASELEEMKDYTDFYYISNPLNTDKFHAIVYGRFEMGSTYYFLCTYDNNGKLISHIDFAAYEMMSAGPQAGQEYYTKGLINKDHEIEVKTEEETVKYKIQEDGKIVEI